MSASTPRRTALACAVSAVLLLAAAALAAGLPGHGPAGGLSWLVLVPLFALADLTVVSISVRRQPVALSLGEGVLLAGLWLLPPREVVVAAAVGMVLAGLRPRPQRLLRSAVNLGATTFATAVAATTFVALDPRQAVDPRGWAVGALAAVVHATVSLALVMAAARLLVGRSTARPWRQLLVAAGMALAIAPASAALSAGVIADQRTLWPALATLAGICVLTWQLGRVTDRNVGLERLHRLSRVVDAAPGYDERLRRTLQQSRELLHAGHSHLVFLGGAAVGEEPDVVEVSLGVDGTLIRTLLDPAHLPAWIERARGRESGWSVDPEVADARFAAMISAPLQGDAAVVGLLVVADPVGDSRTFSADDVRLLESYATHAASALLKGVLLERLRHGSLHDPLTGLGNRAWLDQQLALALATGEPGTGLLVLDLDGFKEVNETLGHAGGDELLREVGRRLTALAAGRPVARLGADEFAVVVGPDATPEVLAAQLIEAVQRPVSVGGGELEISASVGVAVCPQHGSTVAELLTRADAARGAAKASTGSVRTWSTALDSRTPQRLALVRELRRALELGQLLLHFQPQVALVDGRVTGAEALVRWQHPERGLVMPDDFIPAAERSGLIRPLTRVILANAVATCASWRLGGLDIAISVNISARSLGDADLVTDVAGVLLRHDLPASRLTLEVTESSVMTDPERVRRTLDRLLTLGVTVAIDDFGTGQTSLAVLQDLPVQEVKIDKSFVTPMLRDPGRAAVTKAIADLGRTLGMRVVAEGVEDDETLAALRSLGVDAAQGWAIARPLSGASLPTWVEQWQRAQRGPHLEAV